MGRCSRVGFISAGCRWLRSTSRDSSSASLRAYRCLTLKPAQWRWTPSLPAGWRRAPISSVRRHENFQSVIQFRRAPMTTWTKDELDKIAAADELQIASLRPDATLSKPVTIWVVRIGDDLYIRSYKGRGGSWFRAAQAHHAGRIRAGGVEKEVTFVDETDPGINDEIDAA